MLPPMALLRVTGPKPSETIIVTEPPKMRLLFVAHVVPYPPLTGSTAIALNHIRHLAVRHTVDLISFKDRKNPNRLGDLPELCNDIELVDRPPRWRVLVDLVSGIVRDPHPWISRVRSRKMKRAVIRRLADVRYDVVLFQLVQMAQFRPSSYKGPTVWCLEDPPVLKSQRMLSLYSWYERPLVWSWIARLASYERHQASKFERVILVNKQDALDYGSILNPASLDWVPLGIDVDTFRPSYETPRQEGMIVITGNMFHRPNVDAVEHFCKEIFPLVCQRVPSANLWLVGAGPVSKVRKWTGDSRIKVTGFVPDIRPYLQKAMVSACAIRLRIGTQTKILEALACGTPVVTSPEGNHGIGAVSGEQLYVANGAAEFADRVIALLNGEAWTEISKKGRRFVEDNFTWERSVERLEQVLEESVATARTNLVPH